MPQENWYIFYDMRLRLKIIYFKLTDFIFSAIILSFHCSYTPVPNLFFSENFCEFCDILYIDALKSNTPFIFDVVCITHE